MSLPKELCDRTLSSIVERFGLEVALEEALTSPMGPVGSMKVFTGGPLQRVVTISMVVPPIHLDSHMVFAFTPSESAVPHFTLDSVFQGEYHAFHLDLIPRVDLAVNLPYIDAAMHPLTPIHKQVQQMEGLSAAAIDPRQASVMSQWMCVKRATEEAFRAMDGPVQAYLDHWFGLVEQGLPAEAFAGIAPIVLAQRDRANRALIFSPEVDAVWANVDRLLGPEVSAKMRGLLKGDPIA